MIVGIIGRGRMGAGLARALADAGQHVLLAGRTGEPGPVPSGAAGSVRDADVDLVVSAADIVALALPYGAALHLATTGRLTPGRGRTLLDVTNARFGTAAPAAGPHGARAVAAGLPDWRVVKALNTVPAGMLGEPRLDGRPVAVPVAGDDACAKAQVAALIRLLGFAPLDAGGLEQADAVDTLAVLLASISASHGHRGRIGFQVALAPVRAEI